jgi:5-methyltetrahydropteroyltriglutamate--homocysteine methyltransferase
MRVLVVEDEFLLAMDLQQMLEGLKVEVCGPVGRPGEALALAQAEPLDGAFLDINLSNGDSFGIAEVLRARGIPFAFLTGYQQLRLPGGLGGSPRLIKPVQETELQEASTPSPEGARLRAVREHERGGEMSEPRPPFRADHVGSLLRPESVKEARRKHFDEKSIPAEELKAIEDAAIGEAIALQEEVGLLAVTDGEYRRRFWHYDFMGGLTGFEFETRDEGVQFHGVQIPPVFPTIRRKLDFPDDHPMLAHFRFVAANTRVTPKISIPGPSCCHFRTARADIAPAEYRDLDVLFADIAATYRKAVRAFYGAGCRYLQMDDIFFAYLCDPKQRAVREAEGEDPDWLIDRYAWMMHEAIRDRPSDMLIAMHLCRGNFRSTYAAEGAYDPAADAVFNRTSVDVFFMEYDTERAGGLEPLRLLARGRQRVMPGFITTKTGKLESIDGLKRKFEEASKYADLDQLGIAPQCGFASTEEGNELTHDDQRRKLELVVRTAEEIWGGVAA